jgi:hypothetical protein
MACQQPGAMEFVNYFFRNETSEADRKSNEYFLEAFSFVFESTSDIL